MTNVFNTMRSLVAVALMCVMPIALTGCVPSASQVAADGSAVANALLSIAALEQPTDPTAAANLITAANTLKAATGNWQTGSPTTDINTAAAAVEAVLAVIPVTAAYAPFVAIAVAALDAILAATGVKGAAASAVVANNPYHGKVKLNRSLRHPTMVGAFKAAWNKQAKSMPGLDVVVLK